MLFNTSQVPQEEEQKVKRSFSYQDIVNLQSKNLYSSVGKMINSQKPSAYRATFGKSERKDSKKVLEPARMAQLDNYGKEGKGPGAYLPPRYVLENGQVIQNANPAQKCQFASAPSHKFPKSQKKPFDRERYNYYNYKNDELEINQADLTRKNSAPSIVIGVNERFPKQRADKITPGPTYDPIIRPQVPKAPQYTLGSRRKLKGQDPLVPSTSTTALVGPSSYFKKGRSQSTGQLNRVPVDSKTRKEPIVSFAKGPKYNAQYKSSVDQTYDLKTKTIMASYDFQYDAGKGLHSGLAFMKKNIAESSQRPLDKNKMKSYTITKASRDIEQKRGTFISMMSNTPASIKISHPKF